MAMQIKLIVVVVVVVVVLFSICFFLFLAFSFFELEITIHFFFFGGKILSSNPRLQTAYLKNFGVVSFGELCSTALGFAVLLVCSVLLWCVVCRAVVAWCVVYVTSERERSIVNFHLQTWFLVIFLRFDVGQDHRKH